MFLKNIFFFLLLLGMLSSCKTDDKIPENPFDKIDRSDTTVIVPVNLDPNSIAGLQHNIFAPTCANSGCHDGTFEPDFRTIESSYNTMVFQPIIKNNLAGDFTHRVKPGNPAVSVLIERLTHDIDGQSGIMPLELEPDSDWPTKKASYIENVRTWIQAGAPDLFGNTPQAGNLQPTLQGMIAYGNGTNPLPRQATTGTIEVPAGTANLKVWLSLIDDKTATADLIINDVKFSINVNDFSTNQNPPLQQQATPKNEEGFSGTVIPYYHKTTLDLSAYSAGDQVFVRVYMRDKTASPVTEAPSKGSNTYIKIYYSFKII